MMPGIISRLFGRKAEALDEPGLEWEAEQRELAVFQAESRGFDPQELPDGTRGCINAHRRERGPKR